MNPSEEPLARRLRSAAIDRTHPGSERVDDYVLDPDGVIDLRELDREKGEVSIAAPAAILATIRGQLGDAAEVADLYAEAEPEPGPPRWRLDLRARSALAAATSPPVASAASRSTVVRFPAPPAPRPARPISRLSLVPTSTSTATETPTEVIPEPSTDVVESSTTEAPSAGEIDLRNGDRPTAECPRCLHTGQRDLFDRFSQVEYYSCDACNHMWQLDRH